MNFVFFFPDEMKASSVSCYGNQHVKMPNYDRLSKEGVRFENCFVQNPVCSPSRCCLMTGRYVHNGGHRTLWHLLRSNEPSLFRYLKNSGYELAWYGKNDLYSQDYLNEVCHDIDEKRNGYKSKPSLKTGLVCKGKNPHKVGQAMAYSFLYDPIKSDGDELIWDESIARGIDFLKSRQADSKPFFLYLPTTMPHPPYNALEQFHHMYDVEKVKADLNKPGATKNKPEFMELIRKYRKIDELDKGVLEKIYAVYLGMNTYVDRMLGGVIDTLDETGLSENTTVIVSSDHGDWAGNYNLVEKWPNAMDDDIVRVPLIIKSPGNKEGHLVKEQVEMFDIMPTVMELAGLSVEHTHFAHSLVGQLKGQHGDKERAVFCEGGYDEHEPHCSEAYEGPYHSERNLPMRFPDSIYYPKIQQQKYHPKSVCRTTMIRTLHFKLVMRTSGENELYDMDQDPRELTNLYGLEAYGGIQMNLEKQMLNWYLRTSDVVPYTDDPRGFID